MKKFMAIYLGTKASDVRKNWEALDPASKSEKEKVGKTLWMNWAIKNQNSIIDHGTPLGKTLKVSSDGISETKNAITAYTIVEAESQQAAAKIFLEHPHFTVFPGDSVEIIECLPMPTM